MNLQYTSLYRPAHFDIQKFKTYLKLINDGIHKQTKHLLINK